ncbi:MAG: hypothetical protein KDA28_17035, partial [Phycisphaerales bacterium]|nr:hypothetical protein [Phycisphaerales bacterium]
MTQRRTAGDLLPPRDEGARISTMSLTLLPIDLIVQWRRCSVAADFLADYFSYLFEGRENAIHVLSTGLNEVIENLAKFSLDKRETVTVTVTHYGEHLRIT